MNRNVMICLSGLLFTAHAVAEMTDWKIEKPYDDNPLVTATIAGSGTTGNHHGQIQLIFNCRKDAPPAVVSLRADAALSDNFPLESFEGPDAPGEHFRLISTQDGKQSWLSSGSRQENNSFEWTFTPSQAELQRWTEAGGSPLNILVATQDKTHTLTASFTLPATKTLGETLAPCMK